MESCLTYLWHWYISVIWIHHTDRRGLRSFAWFLFVSMFLLVFSKFKSVCFSLVSICRFLTLWHISFNAFASPDLIYKNTIALNYGSVCVYLFYVLYFRYFQQTMPLLDDPTLYCVSAWNDQVKWQSSGSKSILELKLQYTVNTY